MKIITVFFARKKQYNKLLKVFTNSLVSAMPEIQYEIIKMPLPVYKNVDHKLDTAHAFIEAAEYCMGHKEFLAVADCDLMFLKSIEDIKQMQFDIAITVRNKKSKMKYNTGLWFFRPTQRSYNFLKQWIKNTKKLMNNFKRYEDFCWLHGGIDQASLYLTMKKYKDKTSILELPCQEWNATQSEWLKVNKKTRVVHIKSKLRLSVFGKIEVKNNKIKRLIDRWKDFL